MPIQVKPGEEEWKVPILHAFYFFLAESCLDKSLLVCICAC